MSESDEVDKRFWRRISVHTKLGGEFIEGLSWNYLPFHTVCQFSWYFEYRAALLKVKYPKYRVELQMGSEDLKPVDQAERLRRMITARKRKITELTTLINSFKSKWRELFSYEEYPPYIKAMSRLHDKIKEKEELEKQLIQITNK